MNHWYIKRGTETAGPLTQERLKELAAQGKIQDTDLIREGETGPFLSANHVSELISDRKSDQSDVFAATTQTRSILKPPKKRNPLLIAVLTILVGVPLLIIVAFGGIFLMGKIEQSRRATSIKRFQKIGLALYNYQDTHRIFPPGGTLTHDEKPYLSWQTFILPYIDHAEVYNQLNHSYPWTHPKNRSLFKNEIPLYLNPVVSESVSADGFGLSHYVGNQNVMYANGGLRYRDFRDGAANTILAIETAENFKPWGDPTNFADPVTVLGSAKKTTFTGGNHVLMADGSVRFIPKNIDPAVLKALSTPAGGERINQQRK